ncbi:hypothetical protein AAIA72_11365 [Hahella sp. SMD15-11]|uniref:Uncharacterized protein n=1 Tax=Thermohahella caldifontis TaxID=3142973 RepID=A0AB39UUC2_9GAMM
MDTELSPDQALELARALREVLRRRRHKRKVLGQVVFVPGQLDEALRLPQVIELLESRSAGRQARGLERFEMIWETLSERTRRATLECVGWYDPDSLPWDDPRSNRRPPIKV